MVQSVHELEEQLVEQEKIQDPSTINEIENRYNHELEKGFGASNSTTFSFGVILCLSPESGEKKRGIQLLKALVKQTIETDLTTAQDSLYYVAVAQLRLGHLELSQSTCARLLRLNPDNKKAMLLNSLVRKKLNDETKKNVEKTVLMTAVGVGVSLLAMALTRKK